MSADMKMLDRLPRRALLGTAPLLLWAAHFALCYVFVAAECSPAFATPEAPRRWVLGVVSVAALAACAWLLWKAPRAWSQDAGLLDWARAASPLLALAGIAWTSLPLVLVRGCG